MNHFIDYIKTIEKKSAYEKSELFRRELLYASDHRIEVYYAPFDYINKDALVMLLGITLGWTQMHNAYVDFIHRIEYERLDDCFKSIKKIASFSGTMRTHLVKMLDEITLNEYLEIDSCSQLFNEANHLVHNTSILRYPVFVNQANYTGSTPTMLKNDLLRRMIHELFLPELNSLNKNILIIPMGKAVSEALITLKQEGLMNHSNILYHFPHPSGANGSRITQFNAYKDYFIKTIKKCNGEVYNG